MPNSERCSSAAVTPLPAFLQSTASAAAEPTASTAATRPAELAEPDKRFITVAIPTYNGATRLPMVLDRLRSQTDLHNISWEIIVCDNGSTDNTATVVRQYQQTWPTDFPLRYRFAAEQGAAFARQYAVESAAGDLIAFLDDDNIPTHNWVAQAYEFAQSHPQAGAIGSQIHGQFETELPAELENIKCFLAIIERGDQPCLYEPAKKILPPAAGLVVRKQAWLDAVPPRLFLNNKGKQAGLASEDLEAILHIQKAGWQVWYNPNMVVYHDIPDGRLKKDYLVTLFRCVGLSRFHIRLLGLDNWKKPFCIPAYIANDIRKLALHRLRHGRKEQLNTVESCDRTILTSTVISPLFLLKKAYKDTVEARADSRHRDRQQWLAQITQAFEQDQFALYQQPVILVDPTANPTANGAHQAQAEQPDMDPDMGHDIGQTQTHQAELLLRLQNNSSECVLPSQFLPTAQRYGLMRTIDRWVIRHLFQTLEQETLPFSALQSIAPHHTNPLYSINLSADSIQDDSLAALIASSIRRVNLPPSLFCFEISAQTALKFPQQTSELTATLHRMGCQITLDSVTLGKARQNRAVGEMIEHLPLDFIKLYPSITGSQHKGAEVAWSQLKQSLQQRSVQAIAKGIESQANLDTVKAQGIRYAQGYQMGRPSPLRVHWQ